MQLNKILCNKAESLGVKIERGKKLKNIENGKQDKIVVDFENETKTCRLDLFTQDRLG